MSPDPNGPPGRVPPEEWLNVFALVTYIPAPLGEFLDQLRRELVPRDDPRAHVVCCRPALWPASGARLGPRSAHAQAPRSF